MKATELAKDTMNVVTAWCADHGLKITKPVVTDDKREAVMDLFTRLVEHYRAPTETRAVTVMFAMELLCAALKHDAEYRAGWEANIAMAFKDQFAFAGGEHDAELVHRIANRAAAAFIDQLIGKDVGEMDGMTAVAALHAQAKPQQP